MVHLLSGVCVCVCVCVCQCQLCGCPAGMESEAWYFDILAAEVTPVVAPDLTQGTN